MLLITAYLLTAVITGHSDRFSVDMRAPHVHLIERADLRTQCRTADPVDGCTEFLGEILRCDDAEDHPQVERSVARRLGVRSILVAPLQHFRRTLGIFEVLSTESFAFDDLAVANLQMLAGFMVAAITRAAGMPGERKQL